MSVQDLISNLGIDYQKKYEGQFDKHISILENAIEEKIPEAYTMLFNQLKEGVIGHIACDYHYDTETIMRRTHQIRFINTITGEGGKGQGILGQYKTHKEYIKEEYQPHKLVPFALADENSFLFLDYRYGPEPGVIIIANSMFAHLAHTFEDFLTKISNFQTFEKYMLIQYGRAMRSCASFGYKHPAIDTYVEEIKEYTAFILSEEGALVISDPVRYMGGTLENTVDIFTSHDVLPLLGLEPKTIDDMTWSTDKAYPQLPFVIAGFAAKLPVKLPETYKRVMSKYNSEPLYANNLIGLNGEQLKISFMTMNEVIEYHNLAKAEAECPYFIVIGKAGSDDKDVVLYYPEEDYEPIIAVRTQVEDEHILFPIAVNFDDLISSFYYENRLDYARICQITRALMSYTLDIEIREHLIKNLNRLTEISEDHVNAIHMSIRSGVVNVENSIDEIYPI